VRANHESDRSAADAVGGRPDERFPRAPTQPPTRAIGPEGEQKEILVSVVATVNATQSQGKIRFVNPTPGGRPSALEPQSAALLRVKSATDQMLSEHPVPVKIFTERAPEADREGLVDAVIPVDPAARTIELVINGKVVDAARVGGAPPAVRGAQRVAVEEKEAGIVLALDRHLDEGHTFSVQVSTDAGRTWQTVGVGLREPTFAIDRRQFRAGQEVQVRLIVTNGLSSSVVMGEPFRS
jgi:hypothetical protein